MYYHASSVGGLQCLKPQISNHGIPYVYFSAKRENTLVYLSNAVEKYCKETGYAPRGPWKKWASYGFTKDGILQLDEYYPDAAVDTYRGVQGYIYSTELLPDGRAFHEIPFTFVCEHAVKGLRCEYIPDAYTAIMEAVEHGKIVFRKYEEMGEGKLRWLRNTIEKEYGDPASPEEYRYFLRAKFPFLQTNGRR